MVRLRKSGLAITLGLLLGLFLFTSGAFAQSVDSSPQSTTGSLAVATGIMQGVNMTQMQQAGNQVQPAKAGLPAYSSNNSYRRCSWTTWWSYGVRHRAWRCYNYYYPARHCHWVTWWSNGMYHRAWRCY